MSRKKTCTPEERHEAVKHADSVIKAARLSVEEMRRAPRTVESADDVDLSVPAYLPGMDPEGEPLFYDTLYHKKTKHGWKVVKAPSASLLAQYVDTHAHLHMLQDAPVACARAAAAGVVFMGAVTDPSEDDMVLFDSLPRWNVEGSIHIRMLSQKC